MTASFEIPAHEATGNGVVKSEKRTCVGRVRALLARTGNSNPGLIVICIQYQSAAPLGGKLARNKRHSSRAVLASTLNAALRAVARLAWADGYVRALKEHNRCAERNLEWLRSHVDELDAIAATEGTPIAPRKGE